MQTVENCRCELHEEEPILSVSQMPVGRLGLSSGRAEKTSVRK